MKLPNGYGTVTKLSGKRRKPFCVKITCGYTDDGKQIRKIIDYAETRAKGIQILAEYHTSPYDIDLRKTTFKLLYEQWLPWKTSTGISKKSITRYTNAYKYYKTIWNLPFIEITIMQIQKIIDNCEYGYATKSDIKTLFCQLYEFAKSIGLPVKNLSTKVINLGKKVKSDAHRPFTEDEIKKLWEHIELEYVDIILLNIYTGMRPAELINPSELHIDDQYLVAGVKTEAGIDRIIPLHDKILKIAKNIYLNNKKEISYQQYNKAFKRVMNALNLSSEHTPYDCRHTFATRMDNVGANKLCIKIIMGHAIQDITDNVYTHKSLKELLEAVNLLD